MSKLAETTNGFLLSPRRIALTLVGIPVLVYAVSILSYVPTVPDLGLRSLFGTTLRTRPQTARPGPDGLEPQPGDIVRKIGPLPIRLWADLLKAPTALGGRRDE